MSFTKSYMTPSPKTLTSLVLQLALASAVIFFSLVQSAKAQNCPLGWPPPGLPANLPCPSEEIGDTVELEHDDRRQRLIRIAASEGFSPEFSTNYLEPSEHQVPGYQGRIPVLQVVFDTDVFFDTGSDVIRPEALGVLRSISQNLAKEPPDVALYVAGHTDTRGSDDANYNLGLSRANKVAEAIARRGIYDASIYRLSFGEGFPRDLGTDSEALARNRRVEFLFAGTPKAGELYIRKIAASPCIALDENGVKTCRRPVNIVVRKVEVSPKSAQEIVALNREETAVMISTSVSDQERSTRLNEIELRRSRIAIMPERKRVAITPNRRVAG